MQQFLRVGEHVTALNGAPYTITTDGDTRILLRYTRCETKIVTRGFNNNHGHHSSADYYTEAQYFIPYSPEMETSGFFKFRFWREHER